jgi:hypothetical protein
MSIFELLHPRSCNPDHLKTLNEMAQIIRGLHPRWGGDRILNAETFLRDYRDQNIEEALTMGLDIEANINHFSQETHLPFKRLHQVANFLCKRVDNL